MCGAPWANDWANVGFVDVFFRYGEYGLVLRGVGPILGNEYGI